MFPFPGPCRATSFADPQGGPTSVGDTGPIPLGDRAEFAALGRGQLSQRARAAARLVREINQRTSGIGKALREAAAGDAELSERLTHAEERRRLNVDQGAQLVAGRPVSDTERDALRRDLGRAIDVFSTAPYPERGQRIAIGEAVGWMMDFLHTHHRGEDAGLWPLVRERNPEAKPLLDVMEADHVRVAPLVEACETNAREYRSTASDEARVAVLAALGRLGEVVAPAPRAGGARDDATPLDQHHRGRSGMPWNWRRVSSTVMA